MRAIRRLGLGTVWLLAGVAPAAMAFAQTAPHDTTTVEDLIVTATKRPEAVRDIPASITAFDERALQAVGADDMSGYLTRIPGVVFNQAVPGNSSAILRGVSTTTGIAQAQGTTGYFINDVPMTDPFYSAGIPDIDTFDVDNVSVLRGPQGTLFGSASLGGAINYQTRKPNLTAFDARVRGTYETTAHGGEGYGGDAMVNLPLLTDKLAVRAVLVDRRDAGYVDNLGTGGEDVNRTSVQGGRLLVTFTPVAGTQLNYLFLRQTESTRDAGAADPTLGDYAKHTLVAEPFSYRTTIHNLRLDQELGFATLTATATHHDKSFSSTQDYSGLAPVFAPVSFLEGGTSKGDTFEARLASPAGKRFEYLVGVFYDSTDELVRDQLVAPSAAPAVGSPLLIDAPVRIRGRESALFGEATYHLTDSLRATVGGRAFRTELDTDTTQDGPLAGGFSETFGHSRDSGFSPKASLTWEPSVDRMVYALVSKGFRFGGPNIAIDPKFAIPSQFGSDSLINYEVGTRTSWLDRRLLLDGTVFYVDWSDIQVSQRSPSGFIYTANAGKARNVGAEASATWRVTPDLRLNLAATYLDGELRRDYGTGASLVKAPTQLPGASRWQVSNSLTYTMSEAPLQPTLVVSHRYISSAPGELTPTPQRQGDYNLFDLRLSTTIRNLELSAFAENIGDVRGVTAASTSVHGPVQYLVRPRTFGLTLDYRL
ncbi:MAG TPA: TonB-dependent receptor [Phenylobacterium sp.]|nr:TonB-dependent receptor [Phenylobacterium sp.]